MTTLRTLSVGFGLLFLSNSMSSCIAPPNYSETPEISPKSVQVKRVVPTNGSATVYFPTVTVSFKDGDGDLGLDSNEKNPPYEPGGPGEYNYFIKVFAKLPSETDFNEIGADGYNSRFPPLTDTPDHKEPIKGDLNFEVSKNLGFAEYDFPKGTQMYFTVRILDRALHSSNTVTTETVTFR